MLPPQPPRPLLLEPPLLEPPPQLPPRPLLLPLPPLFFLLDFLLLLLEQPRPPATCSISSRVKTRMLNSWLSMLNRLSCQNYRQNIRAIYYVEACYAMQLVVMSRSIGNSAISNSIVTI